MLDTAAGTDVASDESRRMAATRREVCHRMSKWIFLMSAPERPCADPVGALCGRSVPSSA